MGPGRRAGPDAVRRVRRESFPGPAARQVQPPEEPSAHPHGTRNATRQPAQRTRHAADRDDLGVRDLHAGLVLFLFLRPTPRHRFLGAADAAGTMVAPDRVRAMARGGAVHSPGDRAEPKFPALLGGSAGRLRDGGRPVRQPRGAFPVGAGYFRNSADHRAGVLLGDRRPGLLQGDPPPPRGPQPAQRRTARVRTRR
ncbi:putative Hemerythrin domain protein [Streptomyces misionensis JCM 4497]